MDNLLHFSSCLIIKYQRNFCSQFRINIIVSIRIFIFTISENKKNCEKRHEIVVDGDIKHVTKSESESINVTSQFFKIISFMIVFYAFKLFCYTSFLCLFAECYLCAHRSFNM